MKKTLGLVLLAGLLVAGMATAVLAASPGDGVRDFVDVGSQSGNAHAGGFVDTDGDSINDNFVDADNNGINDLRGTRGMGGQGIRGTGACDGSDFVDADGDGICDNGASGGGHLRMGGNGSGRTP
jgi:hypothetical protein